MTPLRCHPPTITSEVQMVGRNRLDTGHLFAGKSRHLPFVRAIAGSQNIVLSHFGQNNGRMQCQIRTIFICKWERIYLASFRTGNGLKFLRAVLSAAAHNVNRLEIRVSPRGILMWTDDVRQCNPTIPRI